MGLQIGRAREGASPTTENENILSMKKYKQREKLKVFELFCRGNKSLKERINGSQILSGENSARLSLP